MTGEQKTERSKHWEGQVIDGLFPLHQYLGGSQTGAVFLTEYQGQRAAIKVVTAADRRLDQCLWQWRLASKVSHPHLIRLFKVGRSELDAVEIAYVVMEYAEENLGQVLGERPLTALEAKEMLRPTLDAIAYVHREGFVHGRLEPSNILAIDDTLKLSSDNLSGVGNLDDLPALQGAYRPPEIALGKKYSPAGDIWELGVTLVEALTQRQPEWTETNELILPKGIVEPFRDLVRNCLLLNPQERWTAAALAERLESKAPATKRSRTWWSVAAAAILVIALLAAWIGFRSTHTVSLHQTPVLEAASEPASPNIPPKSPSKSASTGVREPKAPRKTDSPSPAPEPNAPVAPEETSTVASTGTTSPDVTNQVMPDILAKATRSIQGKVMVAVRVHADAYGNVKEAALEPPTTSRYFSGVTLKAVRRWKFRPVREGEVYVPQDWMVRWEFTRSETKVSVERVAP